ncbi:TetR/AcrR family transcriptional regulator [Rufibacter hautae]|uniref:TetR/AcrR family transcriptional regulator n=1 Tax=Rufibacter hautae TaxID=2595005 RepID=A0A5B6TFW2_9BACT|nr:TetR/AcrR family transcriptional regulator [Rufibacter hautae]KAA3438122.1 TetR/AcrR family transcriptional regulator [Rufibacter hautae]
MPKRVAQRETSTQKIIDTALELFAEQGFDRTSIRQIATKAGISLGLLYNYYQSKEDLLKEILVRGRQDILQSFEKPEGLTPFQYLEHHIQTTFRLLEQNKNFWRLYHSLKMQSEVLKALEQEVQAENQLVLQLLSKNLAQAGSTNPSADAVLMFATIDGIAQHYLILPEYPLQEVMERYLVQLKHHLAT